MRSYDLTDGQDPMTHAEIDELKRLVGLLPSPHPFIINIGADVGVSTLAFLEAGVQHHRLLTLWSIDLLPCEQELQHVEQSGFPRRSVIRLLGDSAQIGQTFPYQAHLILVDGNHHYEGVRRDIDAWLPKLLPGGIITFHDYIEHPPANNVTEAWEAVNSYPPLHSPRFQPLGVVDRLVSFRLKGE